MKFNRAEIIGSVTYLPFGPAQCWLSMHLFKNNHMQKHNLTWPWVHMKSIIALPLNRHTLICFNIPFLFDCVLMASQESLSAAHNPMMWTAVIAETKTKSQYIVVFVCTQTNLFSPVSRIKGWH